MTDLSQPWLLVLNPSFYLKLNYITLNFLDARQKMEIESNLMTYFPQHATEVWKLVFSTGESFGNIGLPQFENSLLIFAWKNASWFLTSYQRGEVFREAFTNFPEFLVIKDSLIEALVEHTLQETKIFSDCKIRLEQNDQWGACGDQ